MGLQIRNIHFERCSKGLPFPIPADNNLSIVLELVLVLDLDFFDIWPFILRIFTRARRIEDEDEFDGIIQ
jgi:hypothetical protein